MKKLEERLNLLEQRLALLESQKELLTKPRKPVEELLTDLGLVFLLSHAHSKLVSEPKFGDYDNFLSDIFKCTINENNRMEYAHKLKEVSDEILNKATETYKKSKDE